MNRGAKIFYSLAFSAASAVIFVAGLAIPLADPSQANPYGQFGLGVQAGIYLAIFIYAVFQHESQ